MALEQLETEAFWRGLAPDLPVGPAAEWSYTVVRPSAAKAREMSGVFEREGYIQLPGSQDIEQIGRLARLVDDVRAAGLLPVFAFVFEAMWQPYRRLGPIVDCLLGGQHAFMPYLWAWHVDPARGEAGWIPHRDRPDIIPRPELWSKSVTVWIPLTEATTLNGCMYVMPRHRDPNYGKPLSDGLAGSLNDIRALPAVPGDTLIWTQLLLHWGARTSELATAPRLSMSVEFQRADEKPFSDFFIWPEQALTLAQKLGLIGRAILNYRHLHPIGADLTEAATLWADRLPERFAR